MAERSTVRVEVEGLTLASAAGDILVNGVDLAVSSGEIVALVGESGSGKSLTALAILGLLPRGITRLRGRVRLNGIDVTDLAGPHAAVRGRQIAAIFQDPQASLDPRWTVGRYLAGQFRRYGATGRRAAETAAADMLARVGLGDPGRVMGAYPHELSGGMAQRVMIAGALAAGPQFLIADEPTTALDVTTQAQILDLLEDLQAETGLGVLLITHDLGVVAEMAQRVVVLYGGSVMETGEASDVLGASWHPYTQALLAAMPDLAQLEPPRPIPGSPGDRLAAGTGCPFQPRCRDAIPLCAQRPPSVVVSGSHRAACHRSEPRMPRSAGQALARPQGDAGESTGWLSTPNHPLPAVGASPGERRHVG
ncbi:MULTISPECIES: ABC transporter ATP-binding protein [unclassified Chelatococcus]|uniref:ABC transporter ATP-binding protein n=1 Tax=unclassified Chelatococcus TaxID=2638111 RepID=UPI001BD16D69|nr:MULTISPECIES: ABC transporter ATP-binding protein [unclassified Chelatococcus]CAH1663365.1 putative peptide import ATP-binding protein BAB2_0817 [Hyphomicrobiales bacterium]MBS7741564.1 ABC transporter ATP-binding protein [Chelatococcus sp. HY11]MBX3544417.1 ABC transporter ATP-binding protein [Chelatococcus sp.]MCO5079060.1 ABC transporter ATP-binding protein [Chelatococcus sp.]CAH1682274.1 putative peptide import ATP-binding protein BAB2_0817 [Hyphomicrobiales bacterium]